MVVYVLCLNTLVTLLHMGDTKFGVVCVYLLALESLDIYQVSSWGTKTLESCLVEGMLLYSVQWLQTAEHMDSYHVL